MNHKAVINNNKERDYIYNYFTMPEGFNCD